MSYIWMPMSPIVPFPYCMYWRRFRGLDHRQRVPVIRGGDFNHIEVALPQHLAIIREPPRLLLRGLPLDGPLRRLLQVSLIHVAQRNDLPRRDLHQAEDVGLAVPPAADQADALRPVVGELRGVAARGRQRQAGKTRLKKSTAFHSVTIV